VSLIPTKVGADRKNLTILGGLVVVLAIVFLLNRTPDAPQAAAPPVPVAVPAAAPDPLPPRANSTSPAPSALIQMPPKRGGADRRAEGSIQDFKPTLKVPDGVDISRIDPSLKLDLMAKLQETPLEGGERSLFEFGAEPRPPLPHVDPVKRKPLSTVPVTPVAVTPATPSKPVVPPIPLKFYGYVKESDGPSRRAFFLDGDDIVVAGENDTIRNRYKVIRIGVNSAVVEDITSKNQQTLPLVEELPG
jgi:hypothetical protein